MPVITVARDDHDRRLDRVLRKAFPKIPPGALAGAVRRGAVRLNGKRCRNDTRVREGDSLKVPAWDAPEGAVGSQGKTASVDAGVIRSGPWTIPVLGRTEEWLALNKPAGLTTHGTGSLEEIVRSVSRENGWWAESLSFRPGPVHRLDRNTSGVQLFALTTSGARTLSEELAGRQTFKLYIAVIEGVLAQEREITAPLAYDHSRRMATALPDGRTAAASHRRTLEFSPALTRVVPLMVDRARRSTLIAAIPGTGRTHQIRCHCASIGHPLERDGKYGGGRGKPGDTNDRYLLHALFLAMPDLKVSWNAGLPVAAAETLTERFGSPATVRDHLRELVRATCTTGTGTDTIYL